MKLKIENLNPMGRITDDCSIRAIAKAAGMSWEEAYRLLAEEGIRTGMPMDNIKTIATVLKNLGFVRHTTPHLNGKKITVKEFAESLETLGARFTCAIISVNGEHLIAAVRDDDGLTVVDTSNWCMSRDTWNYWLK